MSAPAPPRAVGRTGPDVGPPQVPMGRRSTPPRWRDARLLVGLLLVLLSVVLGARVVTAADDTVPWLTARADLPAGHVLTDGDLGTTKAHLDPAASVRYFRADSRGALVGRTLIRPAGAGNLLPRDALAYGSTTPTSVVPVLVKAGRLPALRPGDHVDVYVLVKGQQPGSDREVLVVAGVEFLAGDVLGSGDTAAQVRVPVPDAIRVVAASQSERVDLVRVDDGSAPPSGDQGSIGPTETPGFGG
jgi:Flp pilus assembly protein CpaB